LVHAEKKHTEAAIADLSKAGESGLFTAYSVIKQLSGSH